MSLVRKFITTKSTCTTLRAANRMVHRECDQSIELAKRVSEELAARPTRVESMLGVDEDMRDWSLFQILEHNTIVNHEMTQRIDYLVRDEVLISDFDPKKDVMPSAKPGPEQIEKFGNSVDQHLTLIHSFDENLRETKRAPHPVFGMMNAHQWHCMFGFHLMLHRKQMEAIVAALEKST